MAVNPYQKYKEESVMTMTSGEILVLLYEELLKRIRACELFLGQKNYEQFEKHIVRSEEIVQYLKHTLDFKYPISQELNRMYNFFLVQINRVKASRKKEQIAELYPLVQELRDAFDEASKKVGQA